MKQPLMMPLIIAIVMWVLAIFGIALAQPEQNNGPGVAGVLWSVLQAIVNSEAVWAVVIAWLLALIPGPFRDIAAGLLAWLKEWAMSAMAQRQKSAATTAVLAAAQLIKPQTPAGNERAKQVALEVAGRLGIPPETASARIEAAFKEAKNEGLVK